jgi:signal transduction histidine kinase
MSTRRSLRLPIILAIAMIVLLVALTVGWVLLAVFGYLEDKERSAFWVTVLVLGTVFLVLVLAGTVVYLTLSIKAINLNRRQSNFIDSVTHELKSPIASLKLYLQTMSRRRVTDAERDRFHAVMLADVERLDHLINHLLDAARLDKIPTRDASESIDLASSLADCAHSVCLRYRLPQETVRLQLEPCMIRMRRVDLDMIFRNLIDNAVKYAGTPPHVEVRQVFVAPNRCRVWVSDNGTGIPRQLRRKIFGRFVRLGSELERKTPGTGLGLYIVRTLVKRQKGRIVVLDRRDEQGTVFEVELPGAYKAVTHSSAQVIEPPDMTVPKNPT